MSTSQLCSQTRLFTGPRTITFEILVEHDSQNPGDTLIRGKINLDLGMEMAISRSKFIVSVREYSVRNIPTNSATKCSLDRSIPLNRIATK
jgi:hypothetical protein